jgi:hypothetical protein
MPAARNVHSVAPKCVLLAGILNLNCASLQYLPISGGGRIEQRATRDVSGLQESLSSRRAPESGTGPV